METQTLNLTDLICDSLNSIFSKFFSSIDNTTYSVLDDILFLDSSIISEPKFQQLFGTDSTNGLLLLANSLIFGVVLFYIIKFALSHLIYSKIDSPYQFIFKCIIFICCMNSSFWICEKILDLTKLISDGICEIGFSITGSQISFSGLMDKINSALYLSPETFSIFSFDGILKLFTTLGILYILLTYSVRFIMGKLLILLAPFAFLALINNQFDGFFKTWLKQFLMTLSMQIFVAIVLVLGFSLDFSLGDTLSKLLYFAIIAVITKSNFSMRDFFAEMFQYSQNKLKDFV